MRDSNPGRQAAGTERISGLVEKVVYHSEETGFSVLRVKIPSKRDQATVVAVMPVVSAGEWIDAEGSWAVDRTHGLQFKADSASTSRPNTAEGIEKFLGSGLIRGIGPHFAAKLVSAFGAGVFEVIENSPRRLLEVGGIGPVRHARILKAWNEQKAVRDIMVFLHAHGVGTSMAFRIFRTYGETAVTLVREDPYRLARDVPGIGFKTADAIAMRLGVDRLSDLRATAGVEHALSSLTDDGHCAYPLDKLEELAAGMLEIPEDLAAAAVRRGVESGRLVEADSASHGRLVYLAQIEACERILAANLLRILHAPHGRPPLDAEKAASWAEERMGITFSAGQRDALVRAVRSKLLVVTGGPGVGKTTLVSAMVKIFRAKKLRVALCAPTGRASRRMAEAAGMEASTIHRLLGFDPKGGGFKHDPQRPLAADVVIADETSMLDVVLAHQFVRAVAPDATLVFVGDADQLPSVGPGNVLSDMISSGVMPVARLMEVHRQAARSSIVGNAHRINSGLQPDFPQPGGEAEEDFFIFQEEDPAKAARLVVDLVKERIPGKFGVRPVDDIQVLTPMQKGDLGARNLNVVLQEALNPGGRGVSRFGQEFKAGDKVMQTVNDYDKEVFNGEIGRVDRIDFEEGELHVRFDDRLVPYSAAELDELVLSYAVTIHKSQGSEYPCVVIPLHTQHYVMLQRNLLYTAITRGKRLVVIVGSRRAVAIAVENARSSARITTLAERLQAGPGIGQGVLF